MTKFQRIGPLFTDLYELTMAAAYYDRNLFSNATFSLYIRKYPPNRNYFVAAGLENALDELENFHFSEKEIAYLNETGLFSDDFISYLKQLRFSGDVYAMPEGTIFFENEPVLEVTAPIIEAQIIETFLLNTIGFQTMIASKAARCMTAAQGRPLVDFSLRRTQGQDAGIKVARSTYLTGFAATSNVLAGKIYDIPISGTMAHSFISAFNNEIDAFSAFSKTFPKNSVFLIDTYDTLEGARNTAKAAKEMKKRGEVPIGVRLDSGDMAELSQKVRKILDDAGLFDVKIFASSGFDEFKMADVITNGAKIDAFGVGTKMGVSADAPYFDIVYKMVRFNDRDVRKLSPGKITLAGKKQVFRKSDERGRYIEDTIGLRNEIIDGNELMLKKVMANGKTVVPHPSLQDIRDTFKTNFESYKLIDEHTAYPVKISSRLMELQGKV
ncbi:MAG: nicotinate phosphoribosyltransferase [Deltaproteobacteria bacterium]|nr:nicotinate phosphoribosyltransferase [Deltaproteobacteria bacterium]